MSDLCLSEIASNGEEYICHHGVKGMKWGQHLFGKERSSGSRRSAPLSKEERAEARRKSRAERAAARAERRAQKKQDNKDLRVRRHAGRVAKKDITKLSDEELKQHTERLKLEKEFKEAYDAAHPTSRYVVDTLKSIGTQLAKDPNTYVNALKGLDYLMTKTTPEILLEKEKRSGQDAQRKHQMAIKDREEASELRKRAWEVDDRTHKERTDRMSKTYDYIKDTRAQRNNEADRRDNAAKREHELTVKALESITPEEAEEWARRHLQL